MIKKNNSISRQTAIDALNRIFNQCEEIEAHLPEGDPDRTGYKMYPDYVTVREYLHQLPSAEPEPSRDVVDRATMLETYADLYDMFDSYPNICNDIHVVYDKLRNLPSVEPEIIRCRDCEYGEQDHDGDWFCRSYGFQIGRPDGSGFCSEAERRADE